MAGDSSSPTLNDPATLLDVLHLMRFLTIEIVAAVSKTSRDTDEALIKIANQLMEQGKDKRLNERDRLLISALATGLVETEPGA